MTFSFRSTRGRGGNQLFARLNSVQMMLSFRRLFRPLPLALGMEVLVAVDDTFIVCVLVFRGGWWSRQASLLPLVHPFPLSVF